MKSEEVKKSKAFALDFFGAGDVTRTHDLLITNQLHYRLCYTSAYNIVIIMVYVRFVKWKGKKNEFM